jgi:hypothetical protein
MLTSLAFVFHLHDTSKHFALVCHPQKLGQPKEKKLDAPFGTNSSKDTYRIPCGGKQAGTHP